jgi:hypothetical protein
MKLLSEYFMSVFSTPAKTVNPGQTPSWSGLVAQSNNMPSRLGSRKLTTFQIRIAGSYLYEVLTN